MKDDSKCSNPYIKVKIDKLLFDEDSKLKAFATVIIGNSYAVHGLRIFKSDTKGLFAAMPSTAYINSKGETAYRNEFHAITKEAHRILTEKALEAYLEALEGADEETEETPTSAYDFEEMDLLDLPFE